MNDLVEQLLAVEEAAEKATPGTWHAVTIYANRGEVGISEGLPEGEGYRRLAETRGVYCHEDAELIALAANLPFRAVREELEAARAAIALIRPWFEDALANVVGLTAMMDDETKARYFVRVGPASDALDAYDRAVLCPDPAGGEG